MCLMTWAPLCKNTDFVQLNRGRVFWMEHPEMETVHTCVCMFLDVCVSLNSPGMSTAVVGIWKVKTDVRLILSFSSTYVPLSSTCTSTEQTLHFMVTRGWIRIVFSFNKLESAREKLENIDMCDKIKVSAEFTLTHKHTHVLCTCPAHNHTHSETHSEAGSDRREHIDVVGATEHFQVTSR